MALYEYNGVNADQIGVILEVLLRREALKRGESERATAVGSQNELHPTIAESANPIVQEDRWRTRR